MGGRDTGATPCSPSAISPSRAGGQWLSVALPSDGGLKFRELLLPYRQLDRDGGGAANPIPAA